MRRRRSRCWRQATRRSPGPTGSAPRTSTAGSRSAAWTSRASGTRRTTPRCSRWATPARRRSRAACWSPTTAGASSSTRGSRSSASCRRGGPGGTGSSPTWAPWENEGAPRRRGDRAAGASHVGPRLPRRRVHACGVVRAPRAPDPRVPVNALDYAILVCTMVGIAAYGMWRTRGTRDLGGYLKGAGETRWLAIGLSVMATQASAITFLSTPGQGYESGLGFVQNYFGAPLALVIVAAVFLPIYRRLRVYTAYEYLGHRFDQKTRLLGAGLFLIQRGLGAGITIYAPAIVLSTVLGWPLGATIVCSGLLVVVYTVAGGSDAVTLTQKYQIGVIFAGMVAAFCVLVARLPAGLTFTDALTLAGGYRKLEAVDFSLSPDRRYTLWSGLLGGMFLALSYFGTDQSQVQRYLGAASLRESRLGLMFNAVFKVPLQFFILFLGVRISVVSRFERPPVYFNQAAWESQAGHGSGPRLRALDAEFAAAHADERSRLVAGVGARRSGDNAAAAAARAPAAQAHGREPPD